MYFFIYLIKKKEENPAHYLMYLQKYQQFFIERNVPVPWPSSGIHTVMKVMGLKHYA